MGTSFNINSKYFFGIAINRQSSVKKKMKFVGKGGKIELEVS